jgi:hypothetical protein
VEANALKGHYLGKALEIMGIGLYERKRYLIKREVVLTRFGAKSTRPATDCFAHNSALYLGKNVLAAACGAIMVIASGNPLASASRRP